jgi:hypothetical protein
VRRRRFLAALGGAAVVRPIAAAAQPPAAIPRVGVLMGSSPSVEADGLAAFREALEKLGYIDDDRGFWTSPSRTGCQRSVSGPHTQGRAAC